MHTSGDGQAGDGGRLLAGRYRVARQLGRGGMGVVCRAHDEVLGRDVAVKELRTFSDAAAPELADFRLRMQREARAAARVRHPGVIAVHDIAEHEGRPVIVMELVDGPSLDDVLRDHGTLDPAEAADIGAKVLEALAAAHRAGVLHRDVKPGNILLERGGRVVLTDFGIAAVEEPGDGAATHLTRSGELVGSLDYLAPERARGEDPGPPSDVWSLGATLYAAVEGGSPFRRTSTWSTLTAIVAEPLPEARNAGPLEPALHALLEKDPAQRPDAAAAAVLLRQVADGAPGAAGGGADTMQLGAVRGPRPAVPPNPHGGYAPAPGAAHSAPTGGVPGHTDRDTDRSTLSTRRDHERSRRRAVVAASVAAVLLAGAGVAWGVNALGPEGGKEPAAASQAPATTKPSGSQSPGKEGGKTDEEAGQESPGPETSATASASPEQPPAPAAGGPAGGEDGGDGGGAAGGGDGGTDGGGTGGDDSGGGTSGGTSGDTSGGSEPEPVCHPIGGGKYNCQVWQTADSYDAQHQQVGTLYGGTNYFFCQSNLGHRETSGQWTNTWWAKTDDDSGNTGVWVSVVYIEGGENNQPVPGLPAC